MSALTSKKVAGLPVIVWGGILVGGVLLGLWLRSRSSSSSPAGVIAPSSSLDSATLASMMNAAAGGGVAPATGLDPGLESALISSQDALVNQSNYALALAGASTQQASDLATSVTGSAFDFANHFLDAVPVYTVGSSPAGSSPAGTTTPPPAPPPPYSPPPATIVTSVPMFGAPSVSLADAQAALLAKRAPAGGF